MTKPKAIAFDLDGTLAESKERLSGETGALLSQLTRQMPVAVLSGASFEQFQKQFFISLSEEAQLENLFIFPENAAQCYVYRAGRWLPQYDHQFSQTEIDKVFAAIHEALEETHLPTETKIWGEQIENRGNAQITFSGLGQTAPIEAKEKWDPSGEKRKLLRDAIAKRLPEFSIATGGMTSVDITQKGITKAYGLLRLSELTHVPIGEMLYVGDALVEGGNDAVVFETGVPTHTVFSPDETRAFIEAVLHKVH